MIWLFLSPTPSSQSKTNKVVTKMASASPPSLAKSTSTVGVAFACLIFPAFYVCTLFTFNSKIPFGFLSNISTMAINVCWMEFLALNKFRGPPCREIFLLVNRVSCLRFNYFFLGFSSSAQFLRNILGFICGLKNSWPLKRRKNTLTSHFPVPLSLPFKASLSAKFLLN